MYKGVVMDSNGQFHARKPVPEALSMPEIKALAENYSQPEEKALLYFLYTTGCRITEALKATPNDLTWVNHPEYGEVMRVKLINLKNKKNKFRVVPVLMNRYEKPMVHFITDYIKAYCKDKEKPIFNFSRNVAWNRMAKKTIVRKAAYHSQIIDNYSFKNRPHYMRHCRLTHLVQEYGYDALRLMVFAGWSTVAPARIYIHLNWMDLARHMFKGSLVYTDYSGSTQIN